MPDSHYVPLFTQRRGAYERAVCGAYIRPGDHSIEPACLACRAWLDRDTAEALALDATFETRVRPSLRLVLKGGHHGQAR